MTIPALDQDELEDLTPFRSQHKPVVDLRKLQATHNYSLTIWHVEAVKDLAARTKKPEGYIVRKAIELLKNHMEEVDPGA